MAEEIFLQHWLFTRFALPFLLVFVLAYAILQKTKVLGEKTQLNALVSFIMAAIFVGVAYPALVVSNMILFLTVALVVVFVALLIWGFISGDGGALKLPDSKPFKIALFVLVLLVVAIATLWATGVDAGIFDFLFRQDWSAGFWTNVAFIVMIAATLAVVLKSGSGGKGK